MNKTAIKNFATWARNKLIADITYKAGLMGVTDKGIAKPLPQSTGDMQFFDIGISEPYSITGKKIEQRKRLADSITDKSNQSDYSTAFNTVVEEVAYTWFNRLIAVRFMEVNDYLPSHVRVLSSEIDGKAEPDLVTAPFDSDLDFSSTEKELIAQLKLENKLDELFRMLFIKQCNTLNKILPELFEKTSDYTELLLNISCTDPEGVVAHLVNDIEEDDFKEQVQIIGWLYQYYNNERKNEVINIYKGIVKKADVPAATQLFTTKWVVCYMVDNSLGRYWIERNPRSILQKKLQFFVPSKDGNTCHIDEKIEPTDLTFFDPCMGSGHILVYAFDVLIEIYRERGYSDRDAATLILQKNLYGLDIDKRAYQLAYFSLMMKARQYSRRIFTEGVMPQVYCPDGYADGEEYGSLLSVDDLENMPAEPTGQMTLDDTDYAIKLNTWNFRRLLAQKYAVVATNPPYLNKMDSKLKEFVAKEYAPYKADLFSVFMFRNFGFCKAGGYSAFMTPFVWMFIKTYEKLREYIINDKSIATLVQMEYSAFEEATVPICSFVLKNSKDGQNGMYIKLSDFKGGMEVQKQKVLEALADNDCKYLYSTNAENFAKIPGMPVAYWVSERMLEAFENPNMNNIAEPRHGLATSNNALFLKLWFEVNIDKTSVLNLSQPEKHKWVPLNKGGNFRKWYGNNEWIINYENDGEKIKKYAADIYVSASRTIQNTKYYFQKSLTWNALTSGDFSVRSSDAGYIFGSGGYCAFVDASKETYVLALLNNKVTKCFVSAVSPTLNYEVGHIKTIPVIIDDNKKRVVDNIVTQNIAVSRTDWDSFETSWDFVRHPLIANSGTISESYSAWQTFTENQFIQLKANEEELNRIFIDIYGLQDELTPEVDDKDVTVARIYDSKNDIPESMKGNRYALTKVDVVKSFISYAVGCMFGRYSLDVDGLAYAGGDWDSGKYSSFIPDKDNILPITDEAYYEDDIVGRLEEFVKIVYGEQMLEENLEFIAAALGNKGDSSREIIRAYFVKDFFKDHCKAYKKRPIYWLFDSGKQDGFKALVYMHRYDENSIGNLRIDYLHSIQRVYDSEIVRMQETIENSTDGREIATAEKRKEKLIKQLKETKDYDINIAHLALARIAIDLDDGVKVNYEKVQTDTDGNKLDVLGKI